MKSKIVRKIGVGILSIVILLIGYLVVLALLSPEVYWKYENGSDFKKCEQLIKDIERSNAEQGIYPPVNSIITSEDSREFYTKENGGYKLGYMEGFDNTPFITTH